MIKEKTVTIEPAKKSNIVIKEVKTKRDLCLFVDYPNKLYKGVKNFVPAFYGDDIADWDKNKNPAREYCDWKCFLAYRDGEIVGRIGAILSFKSNEKWKTNRMRFSQVDFIDDGEVSDALFAAVENWARESGCDEVHGPLGFCDMDREGMLVEGYDKKSMFITYYNHPYYNDHLERLGYQKDTDWMEYKITAPAVDSDAAILMHRIAERSMKRNNYHIAKLKSRRDYKKYIPSIFNMINTCYAPLYGMVELNDEQVKKYTNKFMPLINPEFVCFVLDEKDEVVAVGISAPSMADAIKKSNGRLFPFGFIGVLKALHKNDTIDMFIIAVRPDLQKTGVNAIILDHILRNCAAKGIKYAETGPMLETNVKVLSQWKMFEKEQHKRRRCYVKNID